MKYKARYLGFLDNPWRAIPAGTVVDSSELPNGGKDFKSLWLLPLENFKDTTPIPGLKTVAQKKRAPDFQNIESKDFDAQKETLKIVDKAKAAREDKAKGTGDQDVLGG